MLIPITFDTPSSSSQKLPPSLAKISHDEVVLLELQGSLEVDSSHPNERDGKLVGTLNIDKDLKRPTLRIGHHLVEGKLANLPKPLAILHRSRTGSSQSQPYGKTSLSSESQIDDSEAMIEATNEDNDSFETESSVQWHAIAIVKRKIVFSKRPMPIVGRPT